MNRTLTELFESFEFKSLSSDEAYYFNFQDKKLEIVKIFKKHDYYGTSLCEIEYGDTSKLIDSKNLYFSKEDIIDKLDTISCNLIDSIADDIRGLNRVISSIESYRTDIKEGKENLKELKEIINKYDN